MLVKKEIRKEFWEDIDVGQEIYIKECMRELDW
jgi:hypothetical protein